jgi:hypothetical protein
MFIIITGPEKCGKTTLARALQQQSRKLGIDAVHIAARGRLGLDPSVYLDYVRLGQRSDVLVIADRGWPDEVIYSQLLQRPTAIPGESWTEWCIGASALTNGCGVVLAPRERLAELEGNDHQLPYLIERDFFRGYGKRRGYVVLHEWNVDEVVRNLLGFFATQQARMISKPFMRPPLYVGPSDPSVVLVDRRLPGYSENKLTWAPMTTSEFQSTAQLLRPWVARTTIVANTTCQDIFDAIRQAKAVVCFEEEIAELIEDMLTVDAQEAPHRDLRPKVYVLPDPRVLFHPGAVWTSEADQYLYRLSAITSEPSNVVPTQFQLLNDMLQGAR